MLTVAALAAVVGLTGLFGAAVGVRRRHTVRQRIEQQLELLQAVPVADYRLRALVG